MKKRYLILAGVLALTVAVAGCGKKQNTETQSVQASATPTPEITKAVVDMQQNIDDSNIKNVMGEKTSTASKVIFVNETGDDIQSVYIRTHVDESSSDYDDDEDGGWGDDLINGMFTLADKDKALYYFEANVSGNSTKSTTSYDIRIAYTDEDKNECFFRDLPLGTISQITLCMDGTDDDAIPYAKYLTGNSKNEFSTLNDVKRRLGLLDDSENSDSSDSEVTPTPSDSDNSSSDNSSGSDNQDDPGNQDDPSDPGSNDNPSDPGSNDNPSDPGNNDDPQPDDPSDPDDPDDPSDPDTPSDPSDDSMISTAEQYIGQSLDALEGACGSPQGSSYEDDPETGKTGFHYYSNFTVSTTVDENGNEIVAGIW